MHVQRAVTALLVLLIFCLPSAASAGEYDHSLWAELLQSHVYVSDDGAVSKVDYRGMQVDHEKLKAYLSALGEVAEEDFLRWPVNDQLAFLINGYNGWTVELILTRYPDLKSIKEFGSLFSSPWKKKFVRLFGRVMSLDDIEHGLIRGSGRFDDPRVHFAVNCASVGCPALRAEPYRGEILDAQLESAARSFLRDRNRNRLSGENLEVSSIFKWYEEDFSSGWRGSRSLSDFLIHYRSSLSLSDAEAADLARGRIAIKFLPYDWSLNALH